MMQVAVSFRFIPFFSCISEPQTTSQKMLERLLEAMYKRQIADLEQSSGSVRPLNRGEEYSS